MILSCVFLSWAETRDIEILENYSMDVTKRTDISFLVNPSKISIPHMVSEGFIEIM